MSLIDKWNRKDKEENRDQEKKEKEIKKVKVPDKRDYGDQKIKGSSLKAKSFITQELESLAKTSDFKRVIYRAILGSSQRGTIDELESDLAEYRKMIELLEEFNIEYNELKKLLQSQK